VILPTESNQEQYALVAGVTAIGVTNIGVTNIPDTASKAGF
jgi:hypothetical protein